MFHGLLVSADCFSFGTSVSPFYQNSTKYINFDRRCSALTKSVKCEKYVAMHFSLPQMTAVDFRFTPVSIYSFGLKIRRWRQRTGSSPGSEGSAVGGRRSEPSEWQRSTKLSKSVRPKILSGTATGHRHHIPTLTLIELGGIFLYLINYHGIRRFKNKSSI